MDDAEFFLPSEMARLVYGHLKTTETNDLPTKFLNESPELEECREFQKQNRTFKTEANGLPLKDILDQYLNINKLILGTVNQLVGDSQKFNDPIEAFTYLLGGPKDVQLRTNGNTENQDSPKSYTSSSSDLFSDFSLNLNKSAEKPKQRRKYTKKKLSTVLELDSSVDRTVQETTPESKEPQSRPSCSFMPRQSTRLKLKKAAKNDRSCNSDSVKEMRQNPNEDCETPCKVGKPPYTVNKIQKPKKTIALSSSDSDSDSTHEPELPTLDGGQSSTSSIVVDRLKGLFSPEAPEVPEKRTVKVMIPRRRPQSSGERSSNNDKTKSVKHRASALFDPKTKTVEHKKSKLASEVSKPSAASASEEKASRSSDEFMPVTNGSQTGEKPKSRRKSDPISANNDTPNPVKLNKSLPVLDDLVFQEKLIKNKKLHEHMAASINEVIMNSPQKNLSEEIENLIGASIQKITSNEMYDSLVHDLIADFNFAEDCEDFGAGQTSSNTESRKNEATTFASLNNHTQLSTNTPVDIEDQLTNTNDDVESQTSERNAIVIEIRGDQILSQEPNVIAIADDDEPERPTAVSDEFRQYFSTTPGIQTPPKENLATVRNDNTSVINVISPDGELLDSCKIANDTSQGVVINGNSLVFPVNERVPVSVPVPLVAITKSNQYQFCGPISTISSQGGRNRGYQPIAPKPEKSQTNVPEQRKILKKRRTRGGKRS